MVVYRSFPRERKPLFRTTPEKNYRHLDRSHSQSETWSVVPFRPLLSLDKEESHCDVRSTQVMFIEILCFIESLVRNIFIDILFRRLLILLFFGSITDFIFASFTSLQNK